MDKNILIIEDTFAHLQIIRELVKGDGINSFPSNGTINTAQKLTNFLTPVNHMLAADNGTLRDQKRQQFLKKISVANPISLYIVDFQIFADKNTYNGIKFCEHIDDIKNGVTPVILLTKFADNEPILNNTSITLLKSSLLKNYPKIRIEIVRKLQDNGSTWDDGERDDNENLKIDTIVTNSHNTKITISNYIKVLCGESENNQSNNTSE